MKKFLSLILVLTLCIFSMTLVASAETEELAFSLTKNTGIISVTGKSMINTYIEPYIPENDNMVIKSTGVIPNITSVKLVVEGPRYGRNYFNTVEYDFYNYVDSNCTIPSYNGEGDYWRLGLYGSSAPVGQFLISNFDSIYTIGIVATGYFETESEQVYYDWGNTFINTDNISAFTIVKDFSTSTDITNTISDLAINVTTFTYTSKEVKNDYPFLANTDINYDNTISRNEVACLSYSELGEGKGISGFEGLASQISTFFNKQKNGYITFYLTTASSTLSTTWHEGRIPIPQNTLNTSTKFDNSLIGLFFNYENVGTLMTSAIIDNTGKITFDISNVLDDIDGNSYLINSVYYGLIGGNIYKDTATRGLKIEKIVLSYEKEEEEISEKEVVIPEIETEITETIQPIDSNDVIVEDEDTTIAIVTSEPETAITTSETTMPISKTQSEIVPEATTIESKETVTEAETTTEAVIETSTTTTTIEAGAPLETITLVETKDTDENPRTGVELMFIAPIMAVAVGVITSKRK